MKKYAIATQSFIHNHVDVNSGEVVAGLSDSALSDLEKSGLVRFEDEGDPPGQGNFEQDKQMVRQPKVAKQAPKVVPQMPKSSQQSNDPAQAISESAQPVSAPVPEAGVVEGQAASVDSQVIANDVMQVTQGD